MSTTYWRNTTDVFDLYASLARRYEDGLIKMRGTFQAASTLSGWRFEPDETGPPTVVIPVFDAVGLIDIVAVDGNVYGATTGKASHLGTGNRIHHSIAEWLAGEIGVLPLKKSFYEILPFAE